MHFIAACSLEKPVPHSHSCVVLEWEQNAEIELLIGPLRAAWDFFN